MNFFVSTARVSALLLVLFSACTIFHSPNANALIQAGGGCTWDENTGTLTCPGGGGGGGGDCDVTICGGGGPGGGGGGGGRDGGGQISPAELQRRATCEAANADWADKECDNRRRDGGPRDNYNINFVFPFPDGYEYDYLRGGAFAFQRALYDDLTGGVWNNFNDYIGRFYQDCERFAGGVRAISVPICKQNVNTYFGQPILGPSGYAGFQGSQAAIDAASSRNGQVCTNLAAVRAQNRC